LIVKTGGRLVLVVDDDGDWRALVADTLAEDGFVVATACDGRAACDCLSRVKPEVVVTDVEMPLMDGCELLAELHDRDRALPVIVMTAEADADASCFAEAFRLIQKPATTDVVVTAVKDALLHRRQTRVRKLWRAAMNRCRRPKAKAATSRPDITPRARKRGRFAVLASIGVVTAAAILLAAMRSTAA